MEDDGKEFNGEFRLYTQPEGMGIDNEPAYTDTCTTTIRVLREPYIIYNWVLIHMF